MRKPEDFKVGMLITPTLDAPAFWIGHPDYLTPGRPYQVTAVRNGYVRLVKNNGSEDGFPFPQKDQKSFFKPYDDVFIMKGDGYSEEEISHALEFIQS